MSAAGSRLLPPRGLVHAASLLPTIAAQEDLISQFPSGGFIGGPCGATRATKVRHPLVTLLPGGPSYDAPHVVAGHTAEPQGPRGLGRVGKQINFLAPTLGTRLWFRV